MRSLRLARLLTTSLAVAIATSCTGEAHSVLPAPLVGATAELLVSLNLGPQDIFDVTAVKLRITSSSAMVVERVQDLTPAAPDSRVEFLLALPPGSYAVEAIPLRSRTGDLASLTCQPVRKNVSVAARQTTAVMLVSQCKPLSQGVDVTVGFNTSPVLESVEIQGGPKLCSSEAARLRAFAKDPDGHTISYAWSTSANDNLCLSSAGDRAVFSAITPGNYKLALKLSDGHGGETSVSVPIEVTHCPNQVLEPVCPGVAVASALGDGKLANPSGRCTCGGLNQAPPYPMWPRSVLTSRRVEQLPERSKACPPTADGAWRGTFIKQVRQRCEPDKPCAYEIDCAYEYTGSDVPTYEGLSALPHDQLLLDQPVMGASAYPSAQPLDADVWRELQKRYRTKLSYVNPAQVLPSPDNLTRVAVVDSAAVTYGDVSEADNFGHGRAVGRIIADLSCHDTRILDDYPRESPEVRTELARCSNFVRNYLALDQVAVGVKDPVHGGYFGDVATLDRAINRALDEWVAEADVTGSKLAPLVMNISAGWDDRHEQRKESALETNPALGFSPPREPGVALSKLASRIQLSLMRASCLGAVVVAAAGNADLDSDVGPIYPAAWDGTAAPTDAECAALGFVPPSRPDWLWGAGRANRMAAPCRPLLYAATGAGDQLDGTGRDYRLANSRLRGTARFAAQALAAVTSEPRTSLPEYTAVLSGSSMAAAAVSGSLAIAWTLRPTLDGHQVIQELRAANDEVVLTPQGNAASADFFLLCFNPPQSAWNVRQCNGIQRATGLACPSADYMTAGQTLTLPSSPMTYAADLVPTGNPDLEALLDENTRPYGVGLVPWLSSPPGSVKPQPPSDTCPTCWVQTSPQRVLGAFDVLNELSMPVPDSASYSIVKAYIRTTTAMGTSFATLFDSNNATMPPVPPPLLQNFEVTLTGPAILTGQPVVLVTVLSSPALGPQLLVLSKALNVN